MCFIFIKSVYLRASYRVGIDGDGLAHPGGVEDVGDDPSAVVDAGGAAGLGAGEVQGPAGGGLQGPEFHGDIAAVGLPLLQDQLGVDFGGAGFPVYCGCACCGGARKLEFTGAAAGIVPEGNNGLGQGGGDDGTHHQYRQGQGKRFFSHKFSSFLILGVSPSPAPWGGGRPPGRP